MSHTHNPALWRQKQRDHMFKTDLGYIRKILSPYSMSADRERDIQVLRM